MNNRVLEFSVGVFVLLALMALAWLTLKVGRGSLPDGETYLVESRFANAGGLHVGSMVTVAGVTVGRVEDVRIDPQDYSAIAKLRLLSALRLPTDSMASIKTSGLIGDRYVALSAGADESFLQAGDRITLTESAVDLESLIGKVAFGSVDKEASNPKPDSTP